MSEDDYRPDLIEAAAGRFVAISGCSGGGKSTLLAALAARGHTTFAEPGRQIVKEEMFAGGDGLPWVDAAKFMTLCLSRALHQMTLAAMRPGLSFFDRGFIDTVSNMQAHGVGVPEGCVRLLERCRFHPLVFMAPPWPELFANDAERRHGFAAAVAEYEMLDDAYRRLGYRVTMLPKAAVAARAAFVSDTLAAFERR